MSALRKFVERIVAEGARTSQHSLALDWLLCQDVIEAARMVAESHSHGDCESSGMATVRAALTALDKERSK